MPQSSVILTLQKSTPKPQGHSGRRRILVIWQPSGLQPLTMVSPKGAKHVKDAGYWPRIAEVPR